MEIALIVSVAFNMLSYVLLLWLNSGWYKDFSKMNNSWSEMLRSYIIEKEDSNER